MGEVYRADDLELAQSVAIKLLPSHIAHDPTLAERVRQEVRLARQITHRNVCRIHDIARLPDDQGGDMFISMEYVDGEDLATLLPRIGRFPQDKAIDIARQLCAALAAAHDQNVIHRDLKPANIMLDGRGVVRLTDFGIAAVSDDNERDAGSGTPAYMAPEQFEGRDVTRRSDIYAVGLILFEMLTGKKAWSASSLQELRTLRSASATPRTLSTTQVEIDPVIAATIERCLQTDPDDRPPSALAVAAALPGGDPLAAALAAGETPSPELIAASGGRGVLKPKLAAVIVAVNVILITASVLLSRGTTLLTLVPPPPAPAIMWAAALEQIRALGYETEARAGDATADTLPTRSGWAASTYSINETSRAIRTGELADWSSLGNQFSSPIRYWLRQEPGGFTSGNPAGEVSPDDPPRTTPGSTLITIDARGNLKSFQRKAPLRISELSGDEPDWSIAFALAGLSFSEFEPIPSRRQAGTDAELRRAWRGRHPADESGLHADGIHVYAGAFDGKICEFAIVGDEPVPDVGAADETEEIPGSESDAGPSDATETGPSGGPDRDAAAPEIHATARMIQNIAQFIVLGTITGVGTVIAYRNIKRRRSDTRRAVRLGVVAFLLTSLTAVLGIDTLAGGTTLLFGPYPVYGIGLGVSFIAIICYIAIEPLARSRWPNSLVSWTRLFSGSFRDPMIGRDLLIGCTAGAVILTLGCAAQAAAAHLTGMLGPDALPPSMQGVTVVLNGPREVLAQMASLVAAGLINSAAIAVLVLLTMLGFGAIRIRRRWPALVTVAALAMAQSLATPNVGWLDRAAIILGNLIVIVLLDRAGLLATAVAIIAASILSIFVYAAPYDEWWATAAVLPALAAAGFLAYGYRVSTAGRSIFD